MSATPHAHRTSRWIAVAVAAVVVAGGGLWLAQRLARDPAIPFLWPFAPAEWIVAAAPASLYAHDVMPIDTVFSRRFTMETAPTSALLRVRAFRHAEVRVNGELVLATGEDASWKSAREADVAARLRAGENDLTVRVENDRGPPALWLALALPNETLISDAGWRASRAGGIEVAAALAKGPPPAPSFDEFRLDRDLPTALHVVWPLLVLTILVCGAIAALVVRRPGAEPGAAGGSASSVDGRAPDLVFAAIAVAWCVLMLASARWLPIDIGFDADGHLEYVEMIRTTGELPLPDDGWQTYHPPLYYLLVAGVLALAGTSVADPAGVWLIHGVNLMLMLVCLLAVRGSLRRLFPAEPRRQALGLLVAGFLPVHLYLFQFVGNEVLAIALGAVAFRVCVGELSDGRAGYGRALLIGVVLGAALLAKLSAALLLPPMLGAVAWRALRSGRGLRHALGLVATIMVATVAVSGWHYARVAAHTGDPFITNWDPTIGFSWWQDPGYRTLHDLLRVRPALVQPATAPSSGLAAGLYSSLWADSYSGGQGQLEDGPPWDRELLALGPLLGFGMSFAIAVGWLVASAAALRTADPALALAPILVVVAVAALLWMGITVPNVSIAKASYGMVALTVPLAVLGAIGLDRLAGRGRWRHGLVLTLVLAWALLSYSTYLLRGSTASTSTIAGRALLASDETAGLALLHEALALDPGYWPARTLVAETELGEQAPATVLVEQITRSAPLEEAPPAVLLLLGRASLLAGNDDAARAYLERAAALAPAFADPRLELALLHGRRGEIAGAIARGRDVLRLKPDLQVAHQLLAQAYQVDGKPDLSRYHQAYAARIERR